MGRCLYALVHSLIHSGQEGQPNLHSGSGSRKGSQFGVSHSWVGIPAPALKIGITFGRFVNLSEPQFLHL